MGEDDMRSREFVEFIRSNRDVIMEILREDDRRTEEDSEPKSRGGGPQERFEERCDEARERFHTHTTNLVKVLSDEEVQKHFFTGCMELLLCMESVIRAMPKTPEMQEVVDGFEKTKKTAMREAVVTGAKAEAHDMAEKITITNLKKKIHDGIHGNDEEG